MGNNLFLLIAFSLLCLTGCEEKPKKFTITASLNGFSENATVIISNARTANVLDTTSLVNNKFISTGIIYDPPIPISIVIKNNTDETATSFIFIGNEDVKIVGNKSDFPDALKVTGSKYQKFKSKLDNAIGPLNKKRDEKLQRMFHLRQQGKWNDSLQKAYWSKENGIIPQIDNQTALVTKKFIENNINSDYALSQLVSYKTDFPNEFIERQLNNLDSDYRNSAYAKVLYTYLHNEPLKKGDKFYDFTAENQNGKVVAFSNFFKEKFVLLEFYSPYCSWCIKALPEIKRLSYQVGDNMEIVTVNVDKNKDDWLKKYRSSRITWTSLYDKEGRYSDVYTKYRVFATPTYYLFDKDGIVVDKWDGYHAELIDEISAHIENVVL